MDHLPRWRSDFLPLGCAIIVVGFSRKRSLSVIEEWTQGKAVGILFCIQATYPHETIVLEFLPDYYPLDRFFGEYPVHPTSRVFAMTRRIERSDVLQNSVIVLLENSVLVDSELLDSVHLSEERYARLKAAFPQSRLVIWHGTAFVDAPFEQTAAWTPATHRQHGAAFQQQVCMLLRGHHDSDCPLALLSRSELHLIIATLAHIQSTNQVYF